MTQRQVLRQTEEFHRLKVLLRTVQVNEIRVDERRRRTSSERRREHAALTVRGGIEGTLDEVDQIGSYEEECQHKPGDEQRVVVLFQQAY